MAEQHYRAPGSEILSKVEGRPLKAIYHPDFIEQMKEECRQLGPDYVLQVTEYPEKDMVGIKCVPRFGGEESTDG